MTEENLARFRAHSKNLRRYRQLLETKLTELERRFIEKRIAEEQSKLQLLAGRCIEGRNHLSSAPV
jgi:hypothetical protein